MKYVIFVLSLLAIISSCENTEKDPQRKQAAELRYLQDKRTGLCFAFGGWLERGYAAHVPCTKKVLALIKE